MYREQTISPWFGALLIAGVFLLIYAGWVLYPRELFRQESVYAVQALEFDLKNLLVTMDGPDETFPADDVARIIQCVLLPLV